jgi:outer membrane protein
LDVSQTNEGLRDYADLKKTYDPKRKQLQAESEEIVNLSKQLQADKVKLSPADQKSRAAAIEAKKKQLGSEAEAAQGAFQQEMEKDFDALAAKVYDVMAGYAKLQGYTVVLDVTQKATPVLYADDSANITEEVVKAYNEKSGVPAPPAPAATAAPKPAPQPSAPPAAH